DSAREVPMSDTGMQDRVNLVQRELRRPVPMTLAIVAVIGWIAVAGFAWSMASQRAEHREEIARLEQTQGNLEELQARVAAAKGELGKLETARTEAQAALETAQKQQASIKTGMQELTQSREKLTQDVSRIERSLADLT